VKRGGRARRGDEGGEEATEAKHTLPIMNPFNLGRITLTMGG
jgi:hypothetical protein